MPERGKRDAPSRRPARRRCAIYTRKSSEEGLEQAFNSLDAQREACEAFVTSQRHEGWSALPDLYDDGGFSGGTMGRPGLKRLLAGIAAGEIDVVVVYKVDRLTRSLADFAKIVELFDAKGVSFVSVTQAFNTTTSMGRLTLNVLLSFAQFEREVTGERIRDKIAASKKKGMWMGGQPPLGYDVHDRKLVVNEKEAETVRHIFRRYRTLRSVRLLGAELQADGIVSKARRAADGREYGSKPISRGALYLMLQNRLYRGEIVHKGTSYPGEHEAIIDEELWEEVQRILVANRVDRGSGAAADQPSLLVGLIHDADGERMVPTHAVKKGKRYRYYVSKPLVTGGGNRGSKGRRIPAASIEQLVLDRIRGWLVDRAAIGGVTASLGCSAEEQRHCVEDARRKSEGWDSLSAQEQRSFLIAIIERVDIHPGQVDVLINPERLIGSLGVAPPEGDANETASADPVMLVIPARLKRAGMEMRMVLDDGARSPEIDPSLVRLVVRASRIRDRIIADSTLTLGDIAREEGVVGSYITRLFRLTNLAPDILTAIIDGRHPPQLSARRLMDDTRLPLDWHEQRQRLGFV